MFKKLILPLVALALAAIFSFQSSAGGGRNDTRVRADLNGTGTLASGKAVYRERMRNGVLEQRFSVEVEDATPGDVLAVTVNGTILGMIVINDLGVGELQYRTPQFIDDPGDGDPIPDGFPHITDGDVCTVGILSGTFN